MAVLPNFLVIGAQKSGTTWLYNFLAEHPDIYVPETRKELMFFDQKRNFRAMGVSGYQEYFSSVTNESAIGEVTPGYLWCAREHTDWFKMPEFRYNTPLRVQNHLGSDIKLIAILRNPIDRALSGFLHHRKRKRLTSRDTLDEQIGKMGIVHMGFYASHLARWNMFFPVEQFYITTYDKLFSDPDVCTEILRFLGVDENFRSDQTKRFYNRGIGFTRHDDNVIDSHGHKIAQKATIDKLRAAYADDVAALREKWKIDLSPWADDFPV